jgi:hypothetical protein
LINVIWMVPLLLSIQPAPEARHDGHSPQMRIKREHGEQLASLGVVDPAIDDDHVGHYLLDARITSLDRFDDDDTVVCLIVHQGVEQFLAVTVLTDGDDVQHWSVHDAVPRVANNRQSPRRRFAGATARAVAREAALDNGLAATELAPYDE